MKQLKKLKLNKLSEDFLNEQEMNILRGGGTPGNCNCGCGYANHGGSSSSSNSSANNSKGYTESYGGSGGTQPANTTWGYPCSMQINSNLDCISPANCNTEPNKC